MKYFTYIALFIFMSMTSVVGGQTAVQKKGDVAFEANAYVKARKFYKRAVKRGATDIQLFERLGDCYYFTGDYEAAAQWYDRLHSNYEQVKPEYLYKYAVSLKSNQEYDKSDKVMGQFNLLVGEEDTRARLFDAEAGYLEKISAASGKYEVELADFSSSSSEFAPAFYGDQIVFASNGEENKPVKSNHTWNDQPLFDLFTGEKRENGSVKRKRFKGDINTRYHESTVVFTKDLNVVYFTRNNFTQGWYKQDKTGTNRLKLYRATRIRNNRWKIIELPFNSDEYSIGHPALSPDEKTLYFASDMPGGKGLSDLYSVAIDGDNYADPVNLVDINTEGRDTFPFVSADNELYFATDGRPGLGGLDVFVSNISEENPTVTNLGAPVNSPKDDFTFILDVITNKGYVASNRLGGRGDDDIYYVKKLEE